MGPQEVAYGKSLLNFSFTRLRREEKQRMEGNDMRFGGNTGDGRVSAVDGKKEQR